MAELLPGTNLYANPCKTRAFVERHRFSPISRSTGYLPLNTLFKRFARGIQAKALIGVDLERNGPKRHDTSGGNSTGAALGWVGHDNRPRPATGRLRAVDIHIDDPSASYVIASHRDPSCSITRPRPIL